MKKINLIAALIFVLIQVNVLAQTNGEATLSGFVHDNGSGEELIGANVFFIDLEIGTTSNEYGFYSITAPTGKYKVRFSFVGYKTLEKEIDLTTSEKINIALNLESLELDQVVIEAKKSDENIRSTIMGSMELTPKEIEFVPVILGEKDILKTMQLLPGISQAGDGSSGYFVRGGNIDQNLILLDEATVYNPSHLFGFFSVFNSDAIKNAKMIKGNMPPEYGGRLSSVLDIKMKEGNNQTLGFSGGIGLISSRLTIEAPIVKDKGSFLISGRRTYADLILKLSSDEKLNNTELYFYDLNLKANYKLGESDRMYLSGYLGRDVLGYSDQFGFDWGNYTGTLRWNHLFSDKLFSNTSLIISDYDYSIEVDNESIMMKITSGISDINFKSDFQYFINPNNTMRFGVIGYHHTFVPGELSSEGGSLNSKEVEKKYGIELGAYASHEYNVSHRLTLNYGLRYSHYLNVGPGNTYRYDEYGTPTDTTTYSRGDIINQYGGIEPRISSTYLLNDISSMKLSYARNYQYIHLLSTSTTSTPIDVWLPTTDVVKPEISDQVALGYFRNFDNNNWETSVEVYYKYMQNQVDYVNGADIFLNEFIESQLTFGKGWSYGVELSLKKNIGRLTGWLSYTLSTTKREFDEINNGDPYSARQDRTHDFSITGIYKLNDTWTFSLNWIYYTGDAVTYPSGKYTVAGNTLNLFTSRNGSRMPDYHRLDLGATLQFHKSNTSETSLTFSLYNAYNRKNAYTISFEESSSNPLYTEAVRLALFGVVPSITFNFRF